MPQKNNAKKGFTLIELLVVISIIAMLSSIVIANLSKAKIKAQNIKFNSIVHNFQNTFWLAYEKNNRFPGEVQLDNNGNIISPNVFRTECLWPTVTSCYYVFAFSNGISGSSLAGGAITPERTAIFNDVTEFYPNMEGIAFPGANNGSNGSGNTIRGPIYRTPASNCTLTMGGTNQVIAQSPAGCAKSVEISWDLRGRNPCIAGAIRYYTAIYDVTYCILQFYP